jgi:arabinofuranosyltransferase
LIIATLGVVTVLVFRSWVIDDAYITLRTIDNFVNGYGLRWNVAERVQAFTHPLWTFVLLVPYYFTHEAYFTSLLVSLCVSTIAIWLIAFRLSNDKIATIIALGVLALSRAFIDFSASNLENPLSHALIALFAVLYFRSPPGAGAPASGSTGRSRLIALSLTAGLLALNRMDLALLVAPALAVRLWQQRRHAVAAILIGAAPFVVWTAISIVYYGFPFPNTAYAKLAHGVPESVEIIQGFCYLLESLVQDPLTLVATLAAILTGVLTRRRDGWPVVAGIVWYLAYVVGIGGDYMSGRFLAAPFLMAVALLLAGPASDRVRRRRLALLAIVGVVALASKSVVPAGTRIAFLKRHFSDDDPKWQRRRARNTFRHVLDQRGDDNQTSLLSVLAKPNHEFEHEWITLGRSVAGRKNDVFVYGAVGLLGYYAGPRIYVVDAAALGDPLLARLPATFPWFPGHYDRRLPAGYFESLDNDANQLQDPNLHAYYDDLRLVTRGPIWSADRFRAILRLNFGGADKRLADYGSLTVDAEEQPGVCWRASDAGFELWERGLRLRMQTPCTARRFELVVSGPVKLRLQYYAAGKVIATQIVDVPDNDKRSIFGKVASGAAFDRVDVLQANGAEPESVFLLRFSN